jgi:hypothetical protein
VRNKRDLTNRNWGVNAYFGAVRFFKNDATPWKRLTKGIVKISMSRLFVPVQKRHLSPDFGVGQQIQILEI